MKPKYFGLAGICVVVVSAGAMLWLETFYSSAPDGGTGFRAIAAMADIAVPGKTALRRMDRLERSLPILAAPLPHMREPSDLSAFGYVEVSPAEGKGTAGSDGHGLAGSHRLSLAFEGQAKRFCVIDNQFYTEGALLPDGATIIRIESRRVLIAKKSIQQWLAMDPLPKDEATQES